MRSWNALYWAMLALAIMMSYTLIIKPVIDFSKSSPSYGRGIEWSR